MRGRGDVAVALDSLNPDAKPAPCNFSRPARPHFTPAWVTTGPSVYLKTYQLVLSSNSLTCHVVGEQQLIPSYANFYATALPPRGRVSDTATQHYDSHWRSCRGAPFRLLGMRLYPSDFDGWVRYVGTDPCKQRGCP